MRLSTIILVVYLLSFTQAEASWLSRALKNTEKTVNKAVQDTNDEINRTKDKLVGSGNSQATIAEVEQLGEALKESRTNEIKYKDEKEVANAGLLALSAAIIGGIVTLATTGMFGRNDRKDKFLAAVEREWELEKAGFDFNSLQGYKRLILIKKSPVTVAATIQPESSIIQEVEQADAGNRRSASA